MPPRQIHQHRDVYVRIDRVPDTSPKGPNGKPRLEWVCGQVLYGGEAGDTVKCPSHAVDNLFKVPGVTRKHVTVLRDGENSEDYLKTVAEEKKRHAEEAAKKARAALEEAKAADREAAAATARVKGDKEK